MKRDEELQELKTQIVNLVHLGRALTHDLRTPLAAITLATSIVNNERYQLSPEARKNHLDSIQRQAQLLSNSLDDINWLMKAFAPNTTVFVQQVDLEAICDRVIIDVRSMENQEDLPALAIESSNSQQMIGDRRLMTIALRHFLLNLIAITPEAEQFLFVIDSDDTNVTVQIQSPLHHLPPDKIHNLVAVSQDMDHGRVSENHLGYVIACNIVQFHQGFIHAPDTSDTGLSFAVTFPQRPEGIQDDLFTS